MIPPVSEVILPEFVIEDDASDGEQLIAANSNSFSQAFDSQSIKVLNEADFAGNEIRNTVNLD